MSGFKDPGLVIVNKPVDRTKYDNLNMAAMAEALTREFKDVFLTVTVSEVSAKLIDDAKDDVGGDVVGGHSIPSDVVPSIARASASLYATSSATSRSIRFQCSSAALGFGAYHRTLPLLRHR